MSQADVRNSPIVKARISSNPMLEAALNSFTVTFSSWISGSTLPFFPEYTDHGLTHFSSVLSTAVDLMPSEVSDNEALFSAEDCFCLSVSVALHDAGMHLSEDGFAQLLEAPLSQSQKVFGDQPWTVLWSDFRQEQKHWSQLDRLNILSKDVMVSELPEDVREWTSVHRRYVGEFIRRNHPRIAHELALNGVPGPHGFVPLLRPEQETVRSLYLLSGIVARSHGLDLRANFPALEADYHQIDFKMLTRFI
jgi:hypothetical protein